MARIDIPGRAWVASIALLAAACSSAPTNGAPAGDTGIGAVTDAAPSDAFDATPADVGTACGAPPYIREAIRIADLDDTGKEKLQPGARLSFSICSGSFALTDSKGEATALVSRGVPFYVRVDDEGHVPVLFGEENVAIDDGRTLDGHTGLLPRAPVAAALPDYGPDKPSFAIVVIANGSKQCANPFDTKLTVVGHPEAKAVTMNVNWPTDPSPAMIGGSGSVTFFTGLSGGQFVTVAGEKPGCRLGVTGLGQTGRFYLENGAFTIGSAFTADPG